MLVVYYLGCELLTSGFPTLDEIQNNGSLLNKYSTHDGEFRAVPAVRSTCSTGQGTITKIAFIALPGIGDENTDLIVSRPNGNIVISISRATRRFGKFGYEFDVPEEDRIPFNSGDTLWIQHPHLNNSRLRLIHQVGYYEINICWRWLERGPENIDCAGDYDYPLLAIETGT